MQAGAEQVVRRTTNVLHGLPLPVLGGARKGQQGDLIPRKTGQTLTLHILRDELERKTVARHLGCAVDELGKRLQNTFATQGFGLISEGDGSSQLGEEPMGQHLMCDGGGGLRRCVVGGLCKQLLNVNAVQACGQRERGIGGALTLLLQGAVAFPQKNGLEPARDHRMPNAMRDRPAHHRTGDAGEAVQRHAAGGGPNSGLVTGFKKLTYIHRNSPKSLY